jgi:hypothetical protein
MTLASGTSAPLVSEIVPWTPALNCAFVVITAQKRKSTQTTGRTEIEIVRNIARPPPEANKFLMQAFAKEVSGELNVGGG